jgi:hypothetical protein
LTTNREGKISSYTSYTPTREEYYREKNSEQHHEEDERKQKHNQKKLEEFTHRLIWQLLWELAIEATPKQLNDEAIFCEKKISLTSSIDILVCDLNG